MPRRLAVVATLLLGSALAALAQTSQGGFGRRPVFTNDSVSVERILMLPGSREAPHTHAYPMIVVQLTAGTVDFIARDMTHTAANAGGTPFEMLTIAINPERLRGGTAPPAAAPAGVTRTPVLDNTDATITRLEFAPSARETVHMHPYDLVVVPLTTSHIELQLGTEKDMKTLTPGDAFFIPRFEPHAVANLGPETLAVLGVVIK